MASMTQPSSQSAESSSETVDDEALARKKARDMRRNNVVSWLVYVLARFIYSSLRLQHDNMQQYEQNGTGCIYVTWHGRSLIPANYLRNRRYWALVSLSRDGELQSRIFQRFGFQIVRGSTGRGGVKGALQMARKVKEGGALAFTPDGPRGPTHKVQLGVILMAQKSGAPIVPVGISATWRRLFTKSWDSYMIPLPFSRAYWVTGDPIHIPADLDEAGRGRYAELVEIAINRLEREAERRAGYTDYPAVWRVELPEPVEKTIVECDLPRSSNL